MVSKSIDRIELESPLVALLMPPDPERLGWKVSYYTGIAFHNQTVVVRVSGLRRTIHYYIPENLKRLTNPLRREVENFLRLVNPEPLSVDQLEEVLSSGRRIADEALSYIKGLHDFVVIESYSNYAAPTFKSLDVDVVIAVAPGKVALFKGEDYRKATSLYFNMKSPWLITTEDILPLLKPIKIVEFGPKGIEGVFDLVAQVVEASSSL
ncbi:ATPase [Pyrococcus abyssi]|uniref:Uncharacterized protein n=1 Tax=Pyrococcus abyssi (strain GE5 / Orsay) TaxID=272844 RepID=Q9UZ32_PYRAB|nr:ATPase [Pyrococcus abyssi]CAB50227.1 Hypothetical protein PAB1503 [Pyrococcus abyssi GE5]CCE70763.1 TPA: hypothetical protein PAB1503 [Pyrococcus abyssi GE5]